MNVADVPFWITATHWGSRSVLLVLVILSVWSVATMLRCYRLIQSAVGPDKDLFLNLREQVQRGKLGNVGQGVADSLYHEVLRQAVETASQEPSRIDRSIRSLLTLKKTEIERGLTILATLGSNAPFIGLFGTVLGIIQAFGALGTSQGGGASVMVAIAEALVATAVGLFVAIPAVVAFNFLSRHLRVLVTNCEALRDLYVAQLKIE